jgi:outer membrane protein
MTATDRSTGVAAACALALALLFGPSVHAQTTCKAPSSKCVVVGKLDLSVGLGVGERSNPVRGESSIPLVVIPQVSYYGQYFFLDNLELGVTVHESDTTTLNLIATPGYDRVFFYRNDLQNFFIGGAPYSAGIAPLVPTDQPEQQQVFPVRRRHTTYLAGPEWLFDYEGVSGQLDALREVTGEHEGYEVRGAIAVPLLKNAGALVVNTGFTWKSAALVRYYYGVDGLYRPGDAWNPFVKLGYSRPLSERWSLNAFVHYEYLDRAIADSPLVSDHSVLTVFGGVVFKIL